MKRGIMLLGVALLLAGCAGWKGSRMSKITVGMNKAEVLLRLGDPQGAGGRNNVVVYHYVEDRGFWQYDYYFVRFVDDKVESYGREYKSRLTTDTDPPIQKSN
jgi:hypothetical protein